MTVTATNGNGKGLSWIQKEPVVFTAAISDIIRNGILMLIGFGLLKWTEPQMIMVLVFVGSLLTLFQIVVSRGNSTPTANARLITGTEVNDGSSIVVPNSAAARAMVDVAGGDAPVEPTEVEDVNIVAAGDVNVVEGDGQPV